MPILGTKARHVSYKPEDLEGFSSGFARSRRGNLWRAIGTRTVTIFFEKYGHGFKFCVADADGAQFTTKTFATEEAALKALYEVLPKLE